MKLIFLPISMYLVDASDDAINMEQVIKKMQSKQKAIAQAQSILIVGGGPVGVELAGMYSL